MFIDDSKKLQTRAACFVGDGRLESAKGGLFSKNRSRIGSIKLLACPNPMCPSSLVQNRHCSQLGSDSFTRAIHLCHATWVGRRCDCQVRGRELHLLNCSSIWWAASSRWYVVEIPEKDTLNTHTLDGHAFGWLKHRVGQRKCSNNQTVAPCSIMGLAQPCCNTFNRLVNMRHEVHTGSCNSAKS